MRLMSSGAASLADAGAVSLRPIEEPLGLVHTGQGGELARAYYGHQPQATFGSPLYRTYVPIWPRPIVKRSHLKRIRSDFDRWAASHGSVYVAPGALGDAFYIWQRNGHWMADLAAVHEATAERQHSPCARGACFHTCWGSRTRSADPSVSSNSCWKSWNLASWTCRSRGSNPRGRRVVGMSPGRVHELGVQPKEQSDSAVANSSGACITMWRIRSKTSFRNYVRLGP